MLEQIQHRQSKPVAHTAETAPGWSIKNVLLATDFSAASQAAFQAALGACRLAKATLTILHVFEYAEVVPPETGGQLIDLDRVFAGARISLDALSRAARRAGLRCTTIMGSGLAPQTILDIIRAKQIDLAVLGTNPLHGFERLVFGSTAEAVLRSAPCPVLTVGPLAVNTIMDGETKRPILFPTDFHNSTVPVIRYAARLCGATGAPLHCLHVLPRTAGTGFQRHVIPQIMTEALQHVAVESGAAIEPCVCAVTYGSEISNAVVDYARQHNAGLIVLGVRQASIMASHVPAHITYRIIAEAPCPVLTMAVASHRYSSLAAACL